MTKRVFQKSVQVIKRFFHFHTILQLWTNIFDDVEKPG